MNPIISLSKVSKVFSQGTHRVEVLNQLDLKVETAECIAILGKSGSGKSTLLSLLAGLDYADFGTICVDGQDLKKLNQDELSRFRSKKMGIVFQQYHLMSNLSAIENVGIPLELQNQNHFEKAACEALKMVGLAHRLSHFPSELSGGECQRVAIARAIVSEPNLILADEPSGNLDDKTGNEVMALLFRLCRDRGQTLILVTHNQDLAARCDRTLVLQGGKLLVRK